MKRLFICAFALLVVYESFSVAWQLGGMVAGDVAIMTERSN